MMKLTKEQYASLEQHFTQKLVKRLAERLEKFQAIEGRLAEAQYWRDRTEGKFGPIMNATAAYKASTVAEYAVQLHYGSKPGTIVVATLGGTSKIMVSGWGVGYNKDYKVGGKYEYYIDSGMGYRFPSNEITIENYVIHQDGKIISSENQEGLTGKRKPYVFK